MARPANPVALLFGSLCGAIVNFNAANDGVTRQKLDENVQFINYK